MLVLPADILLEIASYLSLPTEVLHLRLFLLCVQSARIFQDVAPALYTNVNLRGASQCLRTLEMLSMRPDRARHVRSLCVVPDNHSTGLGTRPVWGRAVLADGYAVSAAVRRAASRLEVLQRFIWDGEELPPYDDMWFALRVFCPSLKYVAVSLGSILTSPNSHLFDFVGLHGFSMTFKSGFYWQYDGRDLEEAIPGYHRLWDMLIKRCPNLQELVVDGYSPREPVDAHRMIRGRWPSLRKLILGDVVMDWHTSINQAAKRSFIAFLNDHRELQVLHLQGHQPSVGAPSILQDVRSDALEKVTEFGGSLEQLQSFQHKDHIKTLFVPDAILLRESTPLSVSGTLCALSNLSSLVISFTLLHGYDNGGIVRSIASACPYLQHFDFTCACRPSFTFVRSVSLKRCHPQLTTVHRLQETFCRAVRPLSKLRTLNVRIVRSRSEENLAACGTRLARTNPRLNTFKIEFLERRPAPPTRVDKPDVLHSATFELLTDQHGLPLSLYVQEYRRGGRWWKSGAARRSIVDLRPAGYPGTRRGGFASLFLDGTAAGQEMRLICFCIALLVAAVGGCLTI
ncbi:hypothetical protein OF83DRAFT_1060236 [Amylostereum chailletii]|nr:hypothetical protein OF83DRAFT_1060236 [Amylostereum chailletii]